MGNIFKRGGAKYLCVKKSSGGKVGARNKRKRVIKETSHLCLGHDDKDYHILCIMVIDNDQQNDHDCHNDHDGHPRGR